MKVQKLWENCFKEEGGKKQLKPEVLSCAFWIVGIVVGVFILISGPEEPSTLETAEENEILEDSADFETETGEVVEFLPEETLPTETASSKTRRRARMRQIRLTAIYPTKAQVVVRKEEKSGQGQTLPAGTSAVGKTLSAIDTRTKTMARVLLPYGFSHKGTRKIPKNSVAVGVSTFQENGRVSINFQKVIFPDGQDFEFSAYALDAKDFSAGVEGDFHNNLDSKLAVASTLSMVGRMSGVLAHKESLGGEYGRVTIKSNLKDAALDGASQVLNDEARRQLETAQGNAQAAYITLERGKELIVSLTQAFAFKKATEGN